MLKISISSLMLVFIVGCNSTANTNNKEDVKVAKVKTTDYKSLSDSDLKKLAASTKFSASELKAAADKLGLKCSVTKVTGSRIKQKKCSNAYQRLAREEATKTFIERQRTVTPRPPSSGSM